VCNGHISEEIKRVLWVCNGHISEEIKEVLWVCNGHPFNIYFGTSYLDDLFFYTHQKPPIPRSFIHSRLDDLWNVRCPKYFGNDLIFLAWWVCCSLFHIRDFETFGFLDKVSLDEMRCMVFG
jgi:hypothetical protein